MGQKGEITFWQFFYVSWLFILSTEANSRGMSVKIDFSPDYPDFGFFGLFLTGHYLSNYGPELFLAEAFKKAQQPKTFFFSGHENFFRQIDPKSKICYITPLLIFCDFFYTYDPFKKWSNKSQIENFPLIHLLIYKKFFISGFWNQNCGFFFATP